VGGSIVSMWAFWVVAGLVLVAGLVFLVRAFIRFNQAMGEVKKNLAELGEMGPRLQRLAKDVGELTESLEQKRPPVT
jgi:uncharacterized membrane protein